MYYRDDCEMIPLEIEEDKYELMMRVLETALEGVQQELNDSEQYQLEMIIDGFRFQGG